MSCFWKAEGDGERGTDGRPQRFSRVGIQSGRDIDGDDGLLKGVQVVNHLPVVSPDFGIKAGAGNAVTLWDVPQRAIFGRLTGHTGTVAALACAGDVLASGGYDATIRVWSLSAPPERQADGERQPPALRAARRLD